jgi:hypothetical protein
VDALTLAIAADPDLPNGSMDFWDASLENLASMMYTQVWSSQTRNLPAADEVNQLLNSETLFWGVALDLDAVPELETWYGGGAQSEWPKYVRVTTSNFEPIGPADIDAWIFGSPPFEPFLVQTTPEMIGDELYLRVDLDTEAFAAMPPGHYMHVINVYSTTGDYGKGQLNLEVVVNAN